MASPSGRRSASWRTPFTRTHREPLRFPRTKAYLARFFGASTVQGDGRRGGVFDFALPDGASHRDYRGVIDALPDSDAPSLFGLPDNIERSVQRASSALVVAGLHALSVSVGGALKFDRERWRRDLGPLIDAWEASGGGATAGRGSRGGGRLDLDGLEPLEAFVAMEDDAASGPCRTSTAIWAP